MKRVGKLRHRSVIATVIETRKLLDMIQSTTGHVKPCGKQEGPSSKPKYYLVTDSA